MARFHHENISNYFSSAKEATYPQSADHSVLTNAHGQIQRKTVGQKAVPSSATYPSTVRKCLVETKSAKLHPTSLSLFHFVTDLSIEPKMSGRLDGKVAIITGGGSGFGKGMAEKFTKEGAKVIILDITEDAGEKAAKELKCEFVKADVTKRADWERAVQQADEKFGAIHIVVNNAGTTYRQKVGLETKAELRLKITRGSLRTRSQTRISTKSSPLM